MASLAADLPAAHQATDAAAATNGAAPKVAAPKEGGLTDPKSKSEVVLEIHQRGGADMKRLEEHIRKIRCEGLDFGVFSPAPHGLNWKCVVEDAKVSRQDLIDMTAGYARLVERVNFTHWGPWHETGDDDEM
eukprot:TRINITY_DN635_c0_g1_i3.p2 TRINITY_DN635_c0_g1~~TRINITY_DN635_c0_g1_i3.p2  ORF type:complete len:132 (+),score=45.63 TRINITY_DN635_c0_g1_i3:89-484(+)